MDATDNSTRGTPALRRVVVTPSGKPRQFEMAGRSVTFVPLSIKRRHSSKLIVPPAGAAFVRTTSTFDLPLIRTRKFSSYLSHLWFDCGSFYDLII